MISCPESGGHSVTMPAVGKKGWSERLVLVEARLKALGGPG